MQEIKLNGFSIVEATENCIQIQTRFGVIRVIQGDEPTEPLVSLNWDVEEGDIYFFRKRGQIIDIGIENG